MKHIKDIIDDFTSFKEEVGINVIIYNKIQTIISLWRMYLETVLENKDFFAQVKKTYYWLSYDGLKTIISMNPYKHLESEQAMIEKNI